MAYYSDTTNSASSATAWASWSTTSGTDTTWAYWNDGTSSATDSAIYVYNDSWRYWITERQETEGQRAEREEQERQWEARAEQERQERLVAEQTANELLKSELTLDQEQQLQLFDSFMVISESGRKYRVKRRGRVEELDEKDGVVAQWCIHPIDNVPSGDVMLSQKLMLEMDEETFRRVGNRWPAH